MRWFFSWFGSIRSSGVPAFSRARASLIGPDRIDDLQANGYHAVRNVADTLDLIGVRVARQRRQPTVDLVACRDADPVRRDRRARAVRALEPRKVRPQTHPERSKRFDTDRPRGGLGILQSRLADHEARGIR